MEGYEAGELLNFNHETFVTLYRAVSKTRKNRPVVVKKHEFRLISTKDTEGLRIHIKDSNRLRASDGRAETLLGL